MNNHFEPLDNGEVLSISQDALIYIGHTTFRVGEFSEAVRSQLAENTDGWNDDKNSWFTDTGVDCEVLRFTAGGWLKGKVRLRLEFSADDGSSSSTQGTVAQPVPGSMEMPSAISMPDTVATPTSAQADQVSENAGDAGDAGNFMAAALPIAAMAGAAVVGTVVAAGMAGQGKAPTAEDSSEDHNFGLDASSPESEVDDLADLADLDDEDFELDPPQDDFGVEASALDDVDGDAGFTADEFGSLSESNLLAESNLNDNLDSEFANADLSSLGGDEFASNEFASNEFANDEFTNDDLGGDDFSLESPDQASDVELSSLDDVDFALDEEPLENSLEDQAITSLEDNDFGSRAEVDLSDLAEDNFSLDTPGEESAISEDFGLDSLDTDFSGLESADFGSGESAASSFENLEVTSLDDEFGLDTPEFGAGASEEPQQSDFGGLDDLLGDHSGSDDLDFLSISEHEKQQFEQAAAEVSQAFDGDFGLDLESRNGLDSLDFDFAGDDAMNAIDQQLSSALDDDLDLLGDAEGLTENLFADEDDALFKDVWGDINKTQVK